MSTDLSFDIVIIGAGLSGLVCAQFLQEKGHQVILLEKSRGLGGRLATRRIKDTCIDHGLSYFLEQGKYSQQLRQQWQQKGLIQPFIPRCYQFTNTLEPLTPCTYYIAPQGITAIAKDLGRNLTILRNHRVTRLRLLNQEWQIFSESSEIQDYIEAKTLISAIPAPQCLQLLQASDIQNFPSYFWEGLASVGYDPCIVVMAGYHPDSLRDIPWDILHLPDCADLAKIHLETSKQRTKEEILLVFYSTSQYAEKCLEFQDLIPVSHHLLNEATQILNFPLNTPNWTQIHRWRYAIPRQSYLGSHLATFTPLPFFACGDWCLGDIPQDRPWHLEKAILSGLEVAKCLTNN